LNPFTLANRPVKSICIGTVSPGRTSHSMHVQAGYGAH
jgi:hypothetical protein